MTKVAILWHMHQPYYGDLDTHEQVLPWVRLHALKDYYGMVRVLQEFPSVRATFNLVPSLLVQLDDLAHGRARDRYLELAVTPAATLAPDERVFLVANFFHAQRARLIEPRPRYAELLRKREQEGTGESEEHWKRAAARFSEQDFRDLQVWQSLAWIDPYYLEGDSRVRHMIAKGANFTEDDKRVVREVERELIGRTIPAYREASRTGQIELSTSPFYHPILPLLCDTDAYTQVRPDLRLPFRFRHPEDAAEQLARGVACHQRLFETMPRGFWPPEGSVSEAIVPLAARLGLGWMATDELILARALGIAFTRDSAGYLEHPEPLYRPYELTIGADRLRCLFRDHVLSDLIGFTYASWPSEAAAADLVGRIVEAGRRYAAQTGGEEAVILIALDGENAWENFEGGGRPFLRALYRRLSEHPELRTVTMSEAAGERAAPLRRLLPGSWAGGDFYIWIGHADDQKAWMQLSAARAVLDEATEVDAAARERAREELFIAEGSDWFWWYGDDHFSDQDYEFDALFRGHVRNAYRALGRPVPDELYATNISVGLKRTAIVPPTARVRPVIDGEVSNEDEWAPAGYPVLRRVFGAMRQSSEATDRVTAIFFGCDGARLVVRVDAADRVERLLGAGLEIVLAFVHPAGLRLVVRRVGPTLAATLEAQGADGRWRARAEQDAEAAAGRILEIAVPLGALGDSAGNSLAFFVVVNTRGGEIERYPFHSPIEFSTRG